MPIKPIEAIRIDLPDEKHVKSRACSIRFRDALAPDLEYINALIEGYNHITTDEGRVEALLRLEQAVDHIDRKYPDELKRYFPDYHEKIHKTFFQAIKQERQALGVSPNEADLSFPEYVAVMDPERAERLLAVLLEPDFTQEKLATRVFDPGEAGYEAFRNMLSRYEIGVLGGGNSKNFTVLDNQIGDTSVLKAENRMGMPKDAVQHLRAHSMKEIFTTDTSEREVMCKNPLDGKPVTRTLLFTDFHPGGDLKKHGKAQISPEKRAESAIDLYLQMTLAVKKIERDGCCFTDMKNGNWLVDKFGELRIADKKGFLYTRDVDVEIEDDYGDVSTQSVHMLDLADRKNMFYAALRSRQLEAPELINFDREKPPIDVDKMHAYMLGKNLYQYLTGCNDSYFFTYDEKGEVNGSRHDANKFKFSDPVFKTPKGAELAAMIKHLIQDAPGDRITLSEAMDNLAFTDQPDLVAFSFIHPELVELKVETYQALKRIEHFKVNDADDVMTAFIAERQEAIQAADTEEALLEILSELKAAKSMLQANDAQASAIKDMVCALKKDSASRVVEKGTRIEAAFLRVPIMERTSIADGKTEAQQIVLNEMGRETSLFKRLIQPVRQTFNQASVDLAPDIKAFTQFKEKFAQEGKKIDDTGLEDQENMSPNTLK